VFDRILALAIVNYWPPMSADITFRTRLFILAMQSMANKILTASQPPVIVRGYTIAACKLVVAIGVYRADAGPDLHDGNGISRT
jgi:hypothetical protein